MKGITSPEGLIMLIVAGLFDITGFIIFALGTWFGIDDYGILEIIGIVIFGLWMFFRYGPLGEDPFLKVKRARARIQQEMAGEEELEALEELEEGEERNNEKQTLPEKTDQKKDVVNPGQESGSTKTPAPAQASPPAKGGDGKKPTLSTKPTGKEWQSPRDIAKDEAWKLTKKALKRFGLTFLIELIPFLGGFYPGWTIFVWKEMKD